MIGVFVVGLVWGGAMVADAHAGDEVVVDQQVASAESMRLSREMEKLADRNAWAGVERNFQELVALGAELTVDDLTRGAHAAQALGDIASARSRLVAANKLQEQTELLDWLWGIDENYSPVYMAGDVGKVKLEVDQMPFNPAHAQVVRFAIQKVQETGLYEGYLPGGNYTFGGKSVEIKPRVQGTRIDLRSSPGKERKKAKKKAKKSKG